jgi:Flp pilus assembly protein TadG
MGKAGAAAVELALVAPVLLLLSAGAYDAANAIQLSLRLERAARAGAQFAMANPTDASTIQSAVIQAWPELTAAEVTVTCNCDATATACGAACSPGASRTVSVTAERSLSPLILASFNKGFGNAVLRLR